MRAIDQRVTLCLGGLSGTESQLATDVVLQITILAPSLSRLCTASPIGPEGVVEVDVDAVGRRVGQRRLEIVALVVEGGVVAEVLRQSTMLSVPPAMPTLR